MIGDEIGRPDLIKMGALGPGGDDGHASARAIPDRLARLGWRPAYDLHGGS